MPFDPNQHHRRSIRLKGYDYSQAGAYFVTICTWKRIRLFGRIVRGEMQASRFGKTLRQEWLWSARIRHEMAFDAFVVMPNHVHGIILIIDDDPRGHPVIVGAHGRAPLHRTPRSLSSFVAGFKSATAKRINAMRGTPGARLWQRNYYERVIRKEEELNAIRRYILDNPAQWAFDRENPDRVADDKGAPPRTPTDDIAAVFGGERP